VLHAAPRPRFCRTCGRTSATVFARPACTLGTPSCAARQHGMVARLQLQAPPFQVATAFTARPYVSLLVPAYAAACAALHFAPRQGYMPAATHWLYAALQARHPGPTRRKTQAGGMAIGASTAHWALRPQGWGIMRRTPAAKKWGGAHQLAHSGWATTKCTCGSSCVLAWACVASKLQRQSANRITFAAPA
jgi:hypothetical protein